ncbi:MAG: hypothetical protein QOF98_1149 [Streptomyces sp.]|jgi:hypothetical protein|nr:hypothetical protein [Streptomyces sp.]
MRVTALLAGATLLTGLLQAVQATGSQAQAPTGSRTATMTLDSLSPRIPDANGSVTISGTVANKGTVKITDAHIGVRLGTGGPLATRSAMQAVTARTAYDSDVDGAADINGQTVDVPSIPAGLSATFSLKVPVSALDLGNTGVYQLSVTLDGQTSVEPWQHVLGIGRTFLPWYESGESAKPTQISYLWPLTDKPHIAARGDTDSQQSPIFLDDDLAAELQPAGRLYQLVELAKDLPVTWVVDPDLLATVEAMTKGYRVAGPGGDVTRTTAGTGSSAAKDWLNALRTAVTGAQVIALPFGDTDIASLAHQGSAVQGSVAHIKTATDLGKTTTDTILGVKSTSNVAWPVDGALDPSIVSVAKTGGATRIIARSDTFADGSVSYTPSAPRPIGDGTTAMVADAQLSTAFSGDMLYEATAEAAIQNFVAQTLLITMQAPQKQRDLLVAPQRMPTVSQAQAMAEAIGEIDSSPWAQVVTFDEAAKAATDPKAGHTVPSASSYPSSLKKQELPAEAFLELRETQIHLNEFVTILTIKDRVTVPFRNSGLRAMSTGWRGDTAGAEDFRNAIGLYLTDLINAVHILDKSNLTLSGRSGTIPVTVKNDLGQPITGLVLRLASNTNIRLEIKNPDQPISIDGGHTRTLKFQTTASANGKVGISAQLYTTDGATYGQGIGFDVNVTKVTDLVMLIIAAGLLLLVLAGVRIYRQRKKQAALDGGAGGAGGGAGGDGGDEGGTGNGTDGGGSNGGDGVDDGEANGTGPGQPGDPAADTPPQSPEPSPAGEKVDG